jgi:hypothetical protein
LKHQFLEEAFLEPRLFRSEIEEIEKGYRYHTVNLSQLDQTSNYMMKFKNEEFEIGHSALNRLDQIVGFNKIWNEYLKTGRREYGYNKNDLRNIWFKENKGSLNFLTYHYRHQRPVVVGVTHLGKNLILPTRVAVWASLYCNRQNVHAEFNSLNLERGLDLNLKTNTNQFEILQNDEMQFKVNLLWDQSRSSSLVTSSYIERLVCMNGTYAHDHIQSTAVSARGSDLGAFRSNMEKGISKELENYEKLKIKLNEIYLKPISDLLRYSEIWLKNKHVPLHIREEILEELKEGPHEVMGDFFNAITSSRHRIRNQGIDLESDGGDRYLGYLAGKLLGNINHKETNLDFLKKYISPLKEEDEKVHL